MVCPLCNSVSLKIKFPVSGENNILLCKSCGLEFLAPQSDEVALKKLYSEEYCAAWGLMDSKGDDELIHAWSVQYLEGIWHFSPPVNFIKAIAPENFKKNRFYLSIYKITVIFKKK